MLFGRGEAALVDKGQKVTASLSPIIKAEESGDSYQLREPSAPYGEHFGVKNEDIGLKNTYFWNFNPE